MGGVHANCPWGKIRRGLQWAEPQATVRCSWALEEPYISSVKLWGVCSRCQDAVFPCCHWNIATKVLNWSHLLLDLHQHCSRRGSVSAFSTDKYTVFYRCIITRWHNVVARKRRASRLSPYPRVTPQRGHCSSLLPAQKFPGAPQPLFLGSEAASGLGTSTSHLLHLPPVIPWCPFTPLASAACGSACRLAAAVTAPAPLAATAAPSSRHVPRGSLGILLLGQGAGVHSGPDGGVGPQDTGCSTNGDYSIRITLEPVMIFWLSYPYIQCQFGYTGREKIEAEISNLILLSILLCQSKYNTDLFFFFG